MGVNLSHVSFWHLYRNEEEEKEEEEGGGGGGGGGREVEDALLALLDRSISCSIDRRSQIIH